MSYTLRQHQPGDMGYIIHKHGVLYAGEYGWDMRFEALVAQVAADFINHFNPEKERCWIAEMDGEIVGSIFIVQKNATTAKLRLLYVDPKARGFGLGNHLVNEAVQFAKDTGYEKVVLWTDSVLKAARHIYEKKGFQLIDSEPHNDFGPDLVGETWELEF